MWEKISSEITVGGLTITHCNRNNKIIKYSTPGYTSYISLDAALNSNKVSERLYKAAKLFNESLSKPFEGEIEFEI